MDPTSIQNIHLFSGAKHCEEERRERRRKEKKKKGVTERIKTEGNEKGKKEEREKSNFLSLKREQWFLCLKVTVHFVK